MEDDNRTWKINTLIAGTVIGALTGFGAALLLTRRAEQEGTKLTISSGQGLKMGMLIAGLLRSIMSLREEQEK